MKLPERLVSIRSSRDLIEYFRAPGPRMDRAGCPGSTDGKTPENQRQANDVKPRYGESYPLSLLSEGAGKEPSPARGRVTQ